MTPEVILFICLQASGKSTFYHARFADTHDLVSKDCFPNNRKPARRQRQLIQESLAASRSVVIDNTNPTVEERAELIALRHPGEVLDDFYGTGFLVG
jgi:predicted kinase